jgi:hypothetical protein
MTPNDVDRARPAGAAALGAVAVGPVARPVELEQLESVDVQQDAGFGPLGTSRARGALDPAQAQDPGDA